MDGARLTRAGTAIAACWLLAACGGDNNDDDSKAKAKARAQSLLTRPIHPRCGLEDYTKPAIKRSPAESGRGTRWTLTYGPKRRTADFSTLLLVQYPPTRRRIKTKGHTTTIAGHRVTTNPPGPRTPVYQTQWQTKRAVYTILSLPTNRSPRARVTGTPPAIARIIRCLP